MHYHYFTIEQRESLERLIRARMAEEPEMKSVLARLHTPDFGVCERCGADIAFARLAEDPKATLCYACKHSKPL
jgi:DnaK suppressor protein